MDNPSTKESKAYRAYCNFVHSIDRGKDRFQLEPDDVKSIGKSVVAFQKGEETEFDVVYLRHDGKSGSRIIFAVDYGGWIPLVWCNATESIVTILPHDVLTQYSKRLNQSAETIKSFEILFKVNTELPTNIFECSQRVKELGRLQNEINHAMASATADEKQKLKLLCEQCSNFSKILKSLQLVGFATEIEATDNPAFLVQKLVKTIKVLLAFVETHPDSEVRQVLKEATKFLHLRGLKP